MNIEVELTPIMAIRTDEGREFCLLRDSTGEFTVAWRFDTGGLQILGSYPRFDLGLGHFLLAVATRDELDLSRLEYRGHWFTGIGPHVN